MVKESSVVLGAQTGCKAHDLSAKCLREQGRPFSLVTGASQGLGRALAEECARLGVNLILVALPDTDLPEISKEFARRYGVATVYQEIDLTEPDSPKTHQLTRITGAVKNLFGCVPGLGKPGL